MNSKLFIVTGVSGSGKTTIARALIEQGEVAFDSKINPGLYGFVDASGTFADTPNWIDKEWLSRHKWVLNRPILESLVNQHQGAKRLFLCGRANIFQYWDISEKVFLLCVTAKTLQQRLNSSSRDNLFARDTDTQQKLLMSLEETQANLIKHGAIVINAEADVSSVVRQVLEQAQ